MMKHLLLSIVVVAACASEQARPSELVRTEPEPVGANCANGGVAVHEGVDLDRDGVLGTSEIVETSYVCNGSPATATLVQLADEPPGDHCEYGGTAIRVGVDSNANRVLDATEVTETRYVCDGADGPSQLVTTAPEPEGLHCAAGGIAIMAGPDDNGDGVLDASEVTSASYICFDA